MDDERNPNTLVTRRRHGMMRYENLYHRPLWQRRRQRRTLIDEREQQSSQQSFH
jgi:hypothetical protein